MLLTIDQWWASEHQFLPNLSIRWSNLILIFSPARSEDISDFVKSLNHFYSKLVAFYRKDRSSSRFELTSTWPTFIRFELQDILNSSCRWYDVEQIPLWILRYIIIALWILIKYLTHRVLDEVIMKICWQVNEADLIFFSRTMILNHALRLFFNKSSVFKQIVCRNHFLIRLSRLIDIDKTYDDIFHVWSTLSIFPLFLL